MKYTLSLSLSIATLTSANASVISIDISGTIADVIGSYAPDLVSGQAVNATFTYNTDESVATTANTTPSLDPGHEYTSFYEFASPPYGGTVNIPILPATFTSDSAAVVVNDDISIDGADLNGAISSGTYDWIEILGSTTIDGPTGYPADGEEWTLALFGPTTWITDGSLIPNDLPNTYTAILVGIEFDALENEIGVVFVNIDTITVVPEPGSYGLSLGLAICAFLSLRRKRSRLNIAKTAY